MSDTLLQRLRQYEGAQSQTTACYNGLRDEAADEIDRLQEKRNFYSAAYDAAEAECKVLRAEIDRLREALEKIEYLDSPQIRGVPSRSSIHEIAKAALAKEAGL